MTSYDDFIVAEAPVLYIPLSDTAGTTATALVGSDGTYSGSPTLDVAGPTPGVTGNGISTDGSNDVMTGPSVALASSAQSFELWLEHSGTLNSSSSGKFLIGSTTGGVNAMTTGSVTTDLTGEVIAMTDAAGGRTGWSGLSIPAGWHHYVIAGDGTQNGWTLFIDGEDSTGSTWTATKISHASGVSPFGTVTFRLARNPGGTYYAFDGIAAFAIYDRELTASEVALHYQAGSDIWSQARAPMVMG